jgi:hypothetical protein
MLLHQFHISHSASRIKATLKLTELRIMWIHVPNGATHYRLLNHLSIISDYTYSEINHRFEPMSKLNTLHAIAYTDYIPVGVPLTDEIVVSLPVTEALSDIDSVIQCVGIEYFVKSGLENFILIRGGSVVVDNSWSFLLRSMTGGIWKDVCFGRCPFLFWATTRVAPTFITIRKNYTWLFVIFFGLVHKCRHLSPNVVVCHPHNPCPGVVYMVILVC